MVGDDGVMNPQNPDSRLRGILPAAAVLGLSIAVGFTVLFALLDMAEGGRAVGLAAFAAVAVGSCIELARDAIILVDRLSRERPTPGALPGDVAEALRRLPVLGQAHEADVYGIYMRYTSEEKGEEEIRAALESQLTSRGGDFRVMGVAAPCLFLDPQGRSKFEHHMPNSNANVRAILVDNKSGWANVRAGLERGHQTILEIETAFGYLDWMQGQWGNRVEYKKTDIALPAFVVITEAWAFVEPYPIVKVTGPMGGRTPMLKLRSGSTGHKIWSDTFEFLWQHHQMSQLP